MLPLFELVIAPVVEAAAAKRLLEIGALRGETTQRLLELVGPDGELHVIDPSPRFDPEEQAHRARGRYIFHRRTSHEALRDIPPVDVALIDGDHNWYTVYHELELLAATARKAGAPLPVLLMHDVGWPYGRRDLYYAPDRIPDEYRHPYARAGLMPGQAKLRRFGGLNRMHNNALREGGPRNGVMTAIDDFLAERRRPIRRVVLPVYFGLAILAEEELVAARPRLGEVLDRLEGPEARLELLELAESLRVKELAQHHVGETEDREARGASRYLEVVKGALLDEHYLENEARLAYLQECIENGTDPDPLALRDPARWRRRDVERLRAERRTGSPVRVLVDRPLFPFTTIGRRGLDHLQRCLETIRDEELLGDFAACGVWRGGSAVFMRAFLDAYEIEERRVWVADSFRGPPEPIGDEGGEPDPERFPNLVADLNVVREGFARFSLLDERVRFLQGSFGETLADAPIDELALLHLGTDQAEATAEALERLHDRVVAGGFVLIAHYDAPGCARAVEEFRARRGIEEPLERVDWTGAYWRKRAAPVPIAAGFAEERARPPMVAPTSTNSTELSVIVVLYEMRREAMRTLHSLSGSYQRGVEDLDYEVVVVENGSSEQQRLGEELVRSFGPQFRHLDLGPDATPSPARAINRGIEIARGEALALMIDGAHVLSPGVLRFGMLGMQTYDPAVVTTHPWYLGPGQQGSAMAGGYDQDYEDRLFEEIAWPADGYRLFEIATPVGERDWFDPRWETNCLFTPRALLEQAGAFDETFSMPGGGYTNLDLFERLTSTPDVTVVDILGEASFHQLHGGTTTNEPEIDEHHSRLMSYREHYENVRRRPFRLSGKPRHVVGSIVDSARRTRPRWLTSHAFRAAQRLDPSGFPDQPTPIPDDLRDQYTDAFWRSLAWRDTTWMGWPIQRPAGDLVAYQELVDRIRPDWIVETDTAAGGRAIFLASICELIGSGRVLSIRQRAKGKLPDHPRISYVTGNPLSAQTLEQVREIIGEHGKAMLVIGTARRRLVIRLFNAYSPLVARGSYVVVEDTILSGHPVLPEYGPGPTEAVREMLAGRRDFVVDRRMERFGLSFNPGGFLRRME
jgi:cephalosporin hydroxylase